MLFGESTDGFGSIGTTGDSGFLISELELEDFLSSGNSGCFCFEELEDEELLDFFLSTEGRCSESLELSGFSGLVMSVTGGFSGSDSVTLGESFGSDFLLESLDEDFFLSGSTGSG